MRSQLKWLLGVIVLLGATSSFAQGERSYIVEPSTTVITKTDTMDEVTKFYIHQKNTTGGTINIGWKKLSLDIPPQWDYSLCDLGLCFTGIPEGEYTMSVEKDSSAFLALNIYPDNVSGTVTLRMLVWDVDHPTISDTLTWIVTATPQAGVHSILANNSAIQTYPNPSSGQTKIIFASVVSGTLNCIDLKGVTRLQIPVIQSRMVDADLSILSAGEYILLLTTSEGSVSPTKFIKY
jgi:hypothetical protein